jgi:hypothetical protein
MRWHELHMQASPISFTRLPTGRDRQLRFERQPRAVSDLERARQVRARTFSANDRPNDAHRVAAGRVEREVRPVDRHVDVLDL